MLKNIYLENFKCFKKQNFNLANLTIFCGCNSSGKSTVIQSILAIKQSKNYLLNKLKKEQNQILLNGNFFKFGTFGDIYNRNADSDNFKIHINDIKFEAKYETKNKDRRELNISDVIGDVNELLFINDFVYLSAERLGPKLQYNITSNIENETLDLGILGENALYEYYKKQRNPAINQLFANKIINPINSEINDSNKPTEIFLNKLVETAMQRIYPDYKMNVREDKDSDLVANSFYISEDPTSLPVRPNNIGFGVSCVLPIIIACCCIKEGGILIVENPEIHLHPKAQSELIKILAILSLCGVQIILETHSDHIINGLRIFIKKQTELEKDISDNFIIYSINNSKVTEIKIDKDGHFDALDDGFFDQMRKDLRELI